MEVLSFIVLALLTRGAASDLELTTLLEKNLRQGLGEVGRIEVQAASGRPVPVKGQLGQIHVRLHQVDARRLPLKRFVPHPRRRILKGRVERFVLEATAARLQGLTLSRLVVTVTDLRFDLLYALRQHDFNVTEVGAASLEGTLAAEDLEAYLAARLPSLREPHLELSPGKVRLTAQADFGLLAASLDLSGRLALHRGKEIHLLDPQLRMNGLPVPAAFAQTLLGRINPLLNIDQLAGLDLPIVLEAVETPPGQLVFRGRLVTQENGAAPASFPW
jgi:hypothetical protein